MDALLDLLVLLAFHWRLGLSVLGTSIVVIFLASTLPWFSGAFGIALVIGSVGAGLLWEGAADSNWEKSASARNEERRNG